MQIFSGSANLKLASEVASILNIQIKNAEITKFANSEVKVRIIDNIDNDECFLIQSTSNPTDTHLMELFFFCDALKRKGAKNITAIIPYFGYARQNREHLSGECVSANVVIKFLEAIGISKVITFDLHDEGTEGIFSIPFKNISSFEVLSKKIKSYLKEKNISTDSIAITSPDQGGVERARNFGKYFFENSDFPIVVIEKDRDQHAIHQSKAVGIYGDVKDKTVILVDDILTSGGTLFNAAELCLEKGAKNIIGAVVHHDFSPDAQDKIQKSVIEKIFTTNTIELKTEQEIPKLEEISIAQTIADTILEKK